VVLDTKEKAHGFGEPVRTVWSWIGYWVMRVYLLAISVHCQFHAGSDRPKELYVILLYIILNKK
jgi:hypothetical protein